MTRKSEACVLGFLKLDDPIHQPLVLRSQGGSGDDRLYGYSDQGNDQSDSQRRQSRVVPAPRPEAPGKPRPRQRRRTPGTTVRDRPIADSDPARRQGIPRTVVAPPAAITRAVLGLTHSVNSKYRLRSWFGSHPLLRASLLAVANPLLHWAYSSRAVHRAALIHPQGKAQTLATDRAANRTKACRR